MGRGDYARGTGPRGFDPVTTTAARAVAVRPAMRFDAAAKAFVYDSDNRLTEGHPVDLAMAMGLTIAQGSIGSSPTTGHTLAQITNLTSPNVAREIEDRVRSANPVARVLSAGDAVIVSIDHEIREHGGLAVAVSFRNLRTADDTVRVVTYPS